MSRSPSPVPICDHAPQPSPVCNNYSVLKWPKVNILLHRSGKILRPVPRTPQRRSTRRHPRLQKLARPRLSPQRLSHQEEKEEEQEEREEAEEEADKDEL
jgi:hypothetical protein